MANTENRSNPTIQDAIGNLMKLRQDNLKVNRDYSQVMVKNIADLGTYQKNLMNENMDIRRKAHSMRMKEALAMAEKETDDTKLQVYLDRINEARKGLSSIVDWRGGREFEGETPLMTMHELRRHKADYDAKLAFDKRDTGGVNIADKLPGYGSGNGSGNDSGNSGVELVEEKPNSVNPAANQNDVIPQTNQEYDTANKIAKTQGILEKLRGEFAIRPNASLANAILANEGYRKDLLYKYNQEAESNPVDFDNINTDLLSGGEIIRYRKELDWLDRNGKGMSPQEYQKNYRRISFNLDQANKRYTKDVQKSYNKNTFMDAISQILRGGSL